VDGETIADFTVGAGSEDVITLNGFGAAFDAFSDVQAAASQAGNDVVIDLGGGDTITLLNRLVGDLHQDDFLFG
ncbi:MAG: calcium-binding protein, partial [Pseudomonadota bacterium]